MQNWLNHINEVLEHDMFELATSPLSHLIDEAGVAMMKAIYNNHLDPLKDKLLEQLSQSNDLINLAEYFGNSESKRYLRQLQQSSDLSVDVLPFSIPDNMHDLLLLADTVPDKPFPTDGDKPSAEALDALWELIRIRADSNNYQSFQPTPLPNAGQSPSLYPHTEIDISYGQRDSTKHLERAHLETLVSTSSDITSTSNTVRQLDFSNIPASAGEDEVTHLQSPSSLSKERRLALWQRLSATEQQTLLDFARDKSYHLFVYDDTLLERFSTHYIAYQVSIACPAEDGFREAVDKIVRGETGPGSSHLLLDIGAILVPCDELNLEVAIKERMIDREDLLTVKHEPSLHHGVVYPFSSSSSPTARHNSSPPRLSSNPHWVLSTNPFSAQQSEAAMLAEALDDNEEWEIAEALASILALETSEAETVPQHINPHMR